MIVLQWLETPACVFDWIGPSDTLPPLRSPSGAIVAAIIGPTGGDGRPGGSTTRRDAVGPISGHRVVRSVPGGCAYASANEADHADAVLGVTVGAATDGVEVEIAVSDEIVEPSWSWTQGPVFLGLDGALVQPAPVGTAFIRQIGFAVAPDRLLLTPRPPVFIQQ